MMERVNVVMLLLGAVLTEAAVDKRCFHHEGTDSYTCLEFIDHVVVPWDEAAAHCASRGAQLMTHEVRARLDFRLEAIEKDDECEFWINATTPEFGCSYMRCRDYTVVSEVTCEGRRPIVCQHVTVDYYKNKDRKQFFSHEARVISVAVLASVLTVSLMLFFARKWRQRVLNRNRIAPLHHYVPTGYK